LDREPGTQSGMPQSYAIQPPASVSFDSAMQISAVWACARLLAESVGSLPLNFFREDSAGKKSKDYGELSRLFGGKVNRYQTRNEFFESLMLNLVLHGNAYALRQYSGDGELIGLMPLMSSQVEVKMLEDGSIVYYYKYNNDIVAYSDQRIWHNKLFGNGVVGLSVLDYARNTIGIAIAGEDRVSQLFKNGGKPTGVLMVDKLLKPEQREQVRNEFRDLKEGNSDKLMVLEVGMKYEQISMSPQDIQLLESRRFQIEDICRFLGVPSVLINDTSGSTTWGSGVQQIVDGFYKLNLRPYLERIESSLIANLVPAEDRDGLEARFDLDALLRADRDGRMAANQTAINSGQLTPNEARAFEGLPPIPGGDTLLVNSTMIPLREAIARQETDALQTVSD